MESKILELSCIKDARTYAYRAPKPGASVL